MSARTPAERWNVAGHDDEVAGIAAAIASGRVPHAWLITGPAGTGRTTLALALARALNCDAPPADRPCNACPSCRRIGERSHPDVTVVDMAWQQAMIPPSGSDRSRARQRVSIEAIRWLRQDIVTRPIAGRWKIQIIDDADLFSESAPEAYLKTLEEPPSFAVIVLIAGSPDAVKETIRSRCRIVTLGASSPDDISAELLRRGIEPTAAGQISRMARGRMAWAIATAETPDALLKRREALEAAWEHLSTPLGRAAIGSVIAAKHSQRRDATYEMLDLWLGLWRDALLLRAGLPEQTSYPEIEDRLRPYSDTMPIADIGRAIWATRRCMQDLDASVQAKIAIQAMVMQWPG